MKATGKFNNIEVEDIVISHRSAMRFWLYCSESSDAAKSGESRFPALSTARIDAAAAEEFLLRVPRSVFDPEPVELLSGVRNSFSTRASMPHLCTSSLPQESFCQIGSHLFVASPELCFTQMASLLSEAQLAKLGTELCGKYYVRRSDQVILERCPITSKAQIDHYLASLGALRGTNKARRVLRHVADNAASPMEVLSYLLLCLPLRLGGYGLPHAVLNHDIHPGKNADLVEQSRFSIDLCWPDSKTGAEYYGALEHPDAIRDRRRLDGLGALGWKIVVIDKERLFNMEKFDIAALQIARHLKRRIRRPDGWWAQAGALRRDLRFFDQNATWQKIEAFGAPRGVTRCPKGQIGKKAEISVR